MSLTPPHHFDVLIIGAGLSGIGAAVHLQKDCPGRSYAILEGRDAIGGTWDLFRYPGVRSDSDMYTLGYKFKPWEEAKAIADGPSIRRYIRAAAAEHDVEKHIRFGHKARAAAWDSAAARWTVTAEQSDGSTIEITCNFLYMCSGYYSYAEGHAPHFAGAADFAGPIVHPQFWPETLDYAGKRVVVIGSGATAVTLVPEIAKTAAHVTMLQRSPTYVVSRPGSDALANRLRRLLPAKLAYSLVRFKNVSLGMLFYRMSRNQPAKIKAKLLDGVRAQLGTDYDVEKHFTPSYNPWDQRLCLVPDADLFTAINSGSASVETDVIDHFDPSGIQLKSGKHLTADIIITATGLKLIALGGMAVSVDGTAVDTSKCLAYKGMMFSGVPNMALSFGYINASWTLRSDLIAFYVGRILNHMQASGTA
ncbi:MAG: NAD(P)/FAD-dependent oxidoreductase, partial [Sandarakinorhabdus sp.]|nr:NAD(P)/FAD-dependent oxidoreductase [Sandarakinorhabdus sp.]